MITKIKDENGHNRLAIVLNYECLEEISNLQNALVWAVKAIANDTSNCGQNEFLWEIANLLGETFLTSNQAHKAENQIFEA